MHEGKITRLGHILRSSGLDELPQLINIIKGDMSFVGPRPLSLYDIKRLKWDTPYYNKRWSVLPGLTGLAQLSRKCHPKITFCYDTYYIKNKSIYLDISIIFVSLLVPLLGKNNIKKILASKMKWNIK